MSEALNTVGPFTIRELSGEGRTLRLAGEALPHRPLELTGIQRYDLTRPPGNPVATLSVLGAAEEPTTIRGKWMDRYIGVMPDQGSGTLFDLGRDDATAAATLNGTPLTNVIDLVDKVDDFRRKGQMVEVTWLHVARWGIIAKFPQRWLNQHDVEWELEFAWTSRPEDEGDPTVGQREVDISDISKAARSSVTDLYDVASSPLLSVNGISDELDTAVALMQGHVRLIEDGLQSAVDGVHSSAAAARGAVSALGSLVGRARDLMRNLESIPYPALAARPDPVTGEPDVAAVTLGPAIAAALGRARLVRTTRALRHKSARDRARLMRSIDPIPVYTVRAVDGQDLRDISTRYFGSPDEWQNLARYNGVSSSRLEAGQVVLVPASFPAEAA